MQIETFFSHEEASKFAEWFFMRAKKDEKKKTVFIKFIRPFFQRENMFSKDKIKYILNKLTMFLLSISSRDSHPPSFFSYFKV